MYREHKAASCKLLNGMLKGIEADGTSLHWILFCIDRRYASFLHEGDLRALASTARKSSDEMVTFDVNFIFTVMNG
jgi:hypothetical protein